MAGDEHLPVETASSGPSGWIPFTRERFQKSRWLDRGERREALPAVLGTVMALAVSIALIVVDTQRAKNPLFDPGDVLLWAPLVAAFMGFAGTFVARRPQVAYTLFAASVVLALFYPLLVVDPRYASFVPVLIALAAWVVMTLHPVTRIALALVAWVPIAVFAYSFPFSDQNLAVLLGLITVEMALLWVLLPDEGPWRTVPFAVVLLTFLAGGITLLVAGVVRLQMDASLVALGLLVMVPILATAFMRTASWQITTPLRLPDRS